MIAHGLLIHIWYHICFGGTQVWPNPTGPCRRRGTAVLTLALPCRPAAQHCWRRQRRCGYGIHWEICWICCWICWPIYVAPSTSFNSRKPWLFFCDSFLGLVGTWWGQEHLYIYITSCKHASIYLGLRYLNSTDIDYMKHVATLGMYDISGTLHHQKTWWLFIGQMISVEIGEYGSKLLYLQKSTVQNRPILWFHGCPNVQPWQWVYKHW